MFYAFLRIVNDPVIGYFDISIPPKLDLLYVNEACGCKLLHKHCGWAQLTWWRLSIHTHLWTIQIKQVATFGVLQERRKAWQVRCNLQHVPCSHTTNLYLTRSGNCGVDWLTNVELCNVTDGQKVSYCHNCNIYNREPGVCLQQHVTSNTSLHFSISKQVWKTSLWRRNSLLKKC